MYQLLFPFRRLLATTFLVVFVNVFVGQCWCATLASPGKRPAAAARVVARPAHAGCHGHAQATAAKPVKQKPGSAGKHDCCKQKSAALLSLLTTPAEKHLFAPAPALLPVPMDLYFRPVAGQWDYTRAVRLVPQEHLPPKIPDIRIFIQSLTV